MAIRSDTGLAAGAGGFTAKSIGLDAAPFAYAGAGGWTLSTHQIDQAVAIYAGAGGWTAGTVQLDQATLACNGTGGLTIVAAALDQAAVSYAGAGGWALPLITGLDQVAAGFAGAGSWSLGAPFAISLAAASWNGAGGWQAFTVQLDAASAELDGAGSWLLDSSIVSPSVNIWYASAQLNGAGGWSAGWAVPAPVPARPNTGAVVVLDAAAGRSYGTAPIVNMPFSFIVNLKNVGVVSDVALKFIAPSGQIQMADDDYVYVGQQQLQQAEMIMPTQYVVYNAGNAEFAETGVWQVIVEINNVAAMPTFLFTVAG